MKRLVIADTAQQDLRDIARYTEREWGAARRQRYLHAIEKRLADLREHPALGPRRDELGVGYRSIQSERHIVFYRESVDTIEIVRVLHEHMDFHRHLDPMPAESQRTKSGVERRSNAARPNRKSGRPRKP